MDAIREGERPMSTKTKGKKTKSVFGVLAVILLLLLIAVTVTANVIFDSDSVPMVGGYYLYMNESAEMEPDIPQNALVFAKQAPVKASAASTASIAQGNKVLCYLPDGNLSIRQIYDMTMDANGDTVYYPATMTGGADALSIPRSNIIALCSWASPELFSFVKFATSVPGLMAFLVVPCIILIALLLIKIARSSKEEIDEDDFFFDEEEVEPIIKKSAKSKKAAPLFDPEKTPGEGDSLEKKKSSISEHFSAKPVNENSPYQKAVQERTMKFKTPQPEDVERAQQEAEAKKKTKKPQPAGTQVFTPSEVEDAAAKPAPQPIRRIQPVENAPAPAVERSAPAAPAPKREPDAAPAPKAEPAPAPKPAAAKPAESQHFSSPNIDDILGSSYHAASSKSSGKSRSDIASSGSIDDLIAVLEKEQKKL